MNRDAKSMGLIAVLVDLSSENCDSPCPHNIMRFRGTSYQAGLDRTWRLIIASIGTCLRPIWVIHGGHGGLHKTWDLAGQITGTEQKPPATVISRICP